jgi:hypothetical protein
MDDFERTLGEVIDQFVQLQNWSKKARNSQHMVQVFPIVLGIDRKLKILKKMDRLHGLRALAQEVRTLFDTREFRAILLAAFNWRSAARHIKERRSADSNRPERALSSSGQVRRAKERQSAGRDRPERALPSSEQAAKDQLMRDFSAFLDRLSATQLQKPLGQEEDLDFYRAGRRLPGSYGSTQ